MISVEIRPLKPQNVISHFYVFKVNRVNMEDNTTLPTYVPHCLCSKILPNTIHARPSMLSSKDQYEFLLLKA